jgi:transketolase
MDKKKTNERKIIEEQFKFHSERLNKVRITLYLFDSMVDLLRKFNNYSSNKNLESAVSVIRENILDKQNEEYEKILELLLMDKELFKINEMTRDLVMSFIESHIEHFEMNMFGRSCKEYREFVKKEIDKAKESIFKDEKNK